MEGLKLTSSGIYNSSQAVKTTVSLSLFVAVLALHPLAARAAESVPYRIVLTSFEPFGLSSKNNSQPVAKRVSQLAATLGENVEVELCNLPVVFDVAAKVAHECIDQHQPDAVVSLGEGLCDLRIETAATNWDSSSLPDNAGQTRMGRPILEDGPRRSGFHFPVQAMYCALEGYPAPVEIATDPGSFVCNNTAYHLSQDLSTQGLPFTFIHVPHSRCQEQERDVEKNAQLIAKMLRAAIAELRAPSRTSTIWARSGSSVKMPATQAEAQTIATELESTNAPACEKKFAQSLVSANHE